MKQSDGKEIERIEACKAAVKAVEKLCPADMIGVLTMAIGAIVAYADSKEQSNKLMAALLGVLEDFEIPYNADDLTNYQNN